MSSPLKVCLGGIPLWREAPAVTETEPGLVSARQLVSYVNERLQGLGGGGTGGSWNGGVVTNPSTFNADVTIGHGPPVWIRYNNTNAGAGWEGIPDEAVPTKSQIDDFTREQLKGPAVCYETLSCPNTWLTRPALPVGWYRAEVLLSSSNGEDALELICAEAAQTGDVQNVTGLAYGGADNSSHPYITWNGMEWFDMNSAPVSRAVSSIVRLDFLYFHRAAAVTSWLGEKLKSPRPGWEKGVARYTGIRPPQAFPSS